ncbi:adult enhancer factor 1, partial [Aplysia californica]|uniref:Adult enhancer factor 1 n=1 Tax=Aplysia californica TaxID=6500 RepID=A0ABM0KBH5_APLCA
MSSGRGRPPSMGSAAQQHSLEQQSLPPHLRALSEHPAHPHNALVEHHTPGGMDGGGGGSHNGRGGLSAYGLDNNGPLVGSRPSSLLSPEAAAHSSRPDSHPLSRSVYSSSSLPSSADRPGSGQQQQQQHHHHHLVTSASTTTSLIEETIAAVASNFGKSPSIGGPIPAGLSHTPHSMMSHLGALGLARSSLAGAGGGGHHMGGSGGGSGGGGGAPGDESLVDLVGRHQSHTIPMLSERASQSLSGLMDEHGALHAPPSSVSGSSSGGGGPGSQLEKTHPCLTCLKMFRSKQQLAQHSLVHTGIRKHICSYCDRAFKQLSHLQQHVRIHTGERKYSCQQCHRGFKQLSHLQKHTRIHSGERKYICSICEKGFKQLSHLQQHFRIHTD